MLALVPRILRRRLYFFGSSLSIVCLTMLIATGKPQNLL